MKRFDFKVTHSLEKVFPETEPEGLPLSTATVFQNEQFSFQLAYRCQDSDRNIKFQLKTDNTIKTSISHVKSVPSDLPAYEDRHDDNYLTTTPGLIPDLLDPISEGELELAENGWNSIWIDIEPNEEAVGEKNVTLTITDRENQPLFKEDLTFEVISRSLPEQKLIHTEWFHSDCLADYYQVDAFSEEHWQIVENFIQTASDNGINMILTPIFTPPLDTEVGGERTTVQLVQVSLENGDYSFDFTQLKRWLDLCKRHNIKYIEVAHLFTQWGAECTPKIIVSENGVPSKKFGWDVKADSKEYAEFLVAFLPELTNLLKEHWDPSNVYFHISDEPHEGNLESYSKAKALAKPFLTDFKIIDALSNYSFFERGIVTKPIVASDHIQPFLDHEVPNLWTYYCCAQNRKVSNRFMAMPSARNRIIATQLFKYDIEGFLHWGYNFYNSQLSKEAIDPYQITDAKKAFPSGDSFLVYPGKNGEALPSIRLRVFYQGLQDLRAFQWLAELKGKQYVLDLIEEEGTITFSEYPQDSDYIFNIREAINKEIVAALA